MVAVRHMAGLRGAHMPENGTRDFILGPELPDISSTKAREASRRGELASLLQLLHPPVAAWMLTRDGHPQLAAQCAAAAAAGPGRASGGGGGGGGGGQAEEATPPPLAGAGRQHQHLHVPVLGLTGATRCGKGRVAQKLVELLTRRQLPGGASASQCSGRARVGGGGGGQGGGAVLYLSRL
jgi:hypothetical protein